MTRIVALLVILAVAACASTGPIEPPHKRPRVGPTLMQ